MITFAWRLFVLVTAAVCSGGAAAQNVVRCGNAYGDRSCPGGQVVPADDARTEAQRAQAAAVNARDARMAQALESARVRAEREARPAWPARLPASAAKPAERQPRRTDKAGPPRPFTAVAPAPPKDAKQSKAARRDAGPKAREKNPPAKTRRGGVPLQG